jgi:hypothetical protein
MREILWRIMIFILGGEIKLERGIIVLWRIKNKRN